MMTDTRTFGSSVPQAPFRASLLTARGMLPIDVGVEAWSERALATSRQPRYYNKDRFVSSTRPLPCSALVMRPSRHASFPVFFCIKA
jgi:hypothetical protein